MPGPKTARRINPRRLALLSQWMLLLIQYMILAGGLEKQG
jgi:hypothetical protein